MKRLSFIIALVIVFTASAFSQDFDKKNLLFRVNPDGNNTVALVGFEKKPKEELIIPEEVSYKGTKYMISTIGDNAFKDCEVLTKVVGTSVQEVKDGAFSGCKNILSAVFTNQMKTVGNRAFLGCSSLQEIVLGENIQRIDDAAFTGCSNLREIAFGNSLTSIGAGIINETGINSIILPSSLTNVGHDAFANNKSLSSVTLSEGIKHIDGNAFKGTSISLLNLPKTIETVGEDAFADCNNLQSISFSEGLKSIATGAFARTGVVSLTFPNSLKEISTSSFEGCKSLQSITLGKDIESIGNKAFAGCSMLSVDYSDVPCEIASDAFAECKNAVIGDYSLKGLSKALNEGKYILEEKKFRNGLIQVSKGGKHGFLNKMGKPVIPCIYDEVEHLWNYNIVKVQKGYSDDYNMGLYSTNGSVIAQCVYEYDDRVIFENCEDGIFPLKRNGKYGFVNKNGEIILPCEYLGVKLFQNGIGWYYNNEAWYAINTDGKQITKTPSPSAMFPNAIGVYGDFPNDIATILTDDGKWILFDRNGNSQILTGYKTAYPHGYGLIRVEKNGKFGLIDKKLNVILPAIYEEINEFNNGIAIVKKGNEEGASHIGDAVLYHKFKEGAIDSTGRVVIPCNYESVSPFVFDYTKISGKGKKWYANKKGMLIDVDYIDVESSDLKNGIYVGGKNGKLGCINKNGEFVTPVKYDKIGKKLCDGLRLVKSNDKYGYIDINGKEIIPLEWSYASDFHDGLAKVAKDGEVYFIDKSGKVVLHLEYDNFGDCHDGMIPVMKDGKFGYVDKAGKLAVPCIYTGEEKYVIGRYDVEDFYEGLAYVKKDNRIGFVDKKGKSTFDY